MTFPLILTLAVIAAVGGGFWVGWWSRAKRDDSDFLRKALKQSDEILHENNAKLCDEISELRAKSIQDWQQSVNELEEYGDALCNSIDRENALKASLREQEQATRLLGEKVKRLEAERLSFVRDSSGRFRKREG